MSESGDYFCPHCGAKLPLGASYCPECGANTAQPQQPGQNAQAQQVNNNNDSSLIFVAILFGALTISMLFFGVYMLMFTGDIMNALTSDTSTWTQIVNQFNSMYGWTESQTYDYLNSTMSSVGWVCIVMAFLSGVCALLTVKKVYWVMLIILTVIISVIMTTTILGLLVGILVLFLEFKSKSSFTS
jgi:ribosomal protein L40E